MLKLANQIDAFRRNVLLPVFHERIGLADYETYTRCLTRSGDNGAVELADFLIGRIANIVRK